MTADRVARKFRGQEFESDATAESEILSLVDYTHAAASELVEDAVMRNGRAEHKLHAMLGGEVRESQPETQTARSSIAG